MEDRLTALSMCPNCLDSLINELKETNRIDVKNKFIIPETNDGQTTFECGCTIGSWAQSKCAYRYDDNYYHNYYLACAHDPRKIHRDLDETGPLCAVRSHDGTYWRMLNSDRKKLIKFNKNTDYSDEFRRECLLRVFYIK